MRVPRPRPLLILPIRLSLPFSSRRFSPPTFCLKATHSKSVMPFICCFEWPLLHRSMAEKNSDAFILCLARNSTQSGTLHSVRDCIEQSLLHRSWCTSRLDAVLWIIKNRNFTRLILFLPAKLATCKDVSLGCNILNKRIKFIGGFIRFPLISVLTRSKQQLI